MCQLEVLAQHNQRKLLSVTASARSFTLIEVESVPPQHKWCYQSKICGKQTHIVTIIVSELGDLKLMTIEPQCLLIMKSRRHRSQNLEIR